MKKLQYILVMIVISTVGFISGCTEEDTTQPTVYVTAIKKDQHPDSTDKWMYYSFDTETVVAASDSSTDKWDIKFRFLPYDVTQTGIGNLIHIFQFDGPIYLNSPNVGNAKGKTKGYILDSAFVNVSYAGDDSKFISDDTANSTRIIPTNLGAAGYFIYSGPPNHTVSTSPSKTLMIKTSGGKYVKFQLQSVYQGAPAVPDMTSIWGYYSFQYVKSDTKTLK
ncbi:MAG: HmuY family protein [Ignavibacteriae bacterium]|nr:HmuY family protein [Ignavibacteriota bacterium]